MDKKKPNSFTPLIIAISVVIGILMGSFFTTHYRTSRLSIAGADNSKIAKLISEIDNYYVDSIDINELIEDGMNNILACLDPHSTYTSAVEVEREMQELNGSFSGIGVIFTIVDDTARIVKVVDDGPSYKSGLTAGDRIVMVDGKSFIGDFLDDEYAMKHLRGPQNSIVKIGVLHKGSKNIQTYTIKRGAVPVKTIDTYDMLDPSTGYIKINSFGENTYRELLTTLSNLTARGCQNLIIDLRGNGGGYMDAAYKIANEFLPNDRLIVYTEGRTVEKKEYRSNGRGTYKNMPIVILTDEMSASASEILAAAIQDNDRGIIVGRRTYGKGLVQRPIEFSDGSLAKLTIARYYSPSGRCLQKPYSKGENMEYYGELKNRYKNGEFSSKDSIHLSGKEYHTILGRIVYGGGGVMPDEFIPADTSQYNDYSRAALQGKLIPNFAYKYVDSNRSTLAKYKWKDLATYLKQQNLVETFAREGHATGKLPRRSMLLLQSKSLLEEALISNIIDYVYGQAEALLYINLTDKSVLKALELIQKKQTFPQKPVATSAAKAKAKK